MTFLERELYNDLAKLIEGARAVMRVLDRKRRITGKTQNHIKYDR